jgi:UDP-hydrolysing UDP-N-acetyl-D-glucosamine 2-epimerase
MNDGRRRIGVVTVARSDYGHLRSVLEAIRDEPRLALSLFVAGAHLAPAFGSTVRDIERDGWPIAARIETIGSSDDAPGIAAATGRAVAGFGGAFAANRPDVLVVLGDRYEMLAAALAALPFTLPVAHIHGGETTEGAMDNQIRHAITKLSHVHLVSAEPHATRVHAMGEERWRVHTVGAPGLDRIAKTPRVSRAELAAELNLPVEDRWLLVTFHPVTLEPEQTADHLDELLAALEKVDAAPVITYPGADTAARGVIRKLQEFAAGAPRARVVPHLGDRAYLSLLAHADAMVGNSSSGIIEAPSFALPVVNVGTRQQGRLRARNVIDVGDGRDRIVAGIEAALAPAFRESLHGLANPYGDGRAGARIVRILRDVALDARLVRKREAE